MKKFILAAVAASVVASPVLAAPNYGHDNNRGRIEQNHRTNVRTYHRGPQVQYQSWRKGQRFDRNRARNYRVVENYRNYRLQAPPRGYRWVQSGNDAVMVGITSGIIAAVLANAIR